VRKPPSTPPHKGDIPIGFLIGFFGLALLVQDRITSLSTPWGEIRAATVKALADAGDIAMLKTQAQTQTATINLVADQATKAKALSETVAKQVTESQNKLAALDTALTAAQTTLTKAQQAEDFMMTVLAAQGGDDRESFDKLRAIADEVGGPFATRAESAWISVVRAHSALMSESGFTVPWKDGVDPRKFNLSILTNIYADLPTHLRPALLKYINNRNDISKQSRLDFLIKVMETDKSLRALEYAGRNFLALSGKSGNGNPMNIEGHLSWWREHRKDFDGK